MKEIHEIDKQKFIEKSLELINEIEATAEILEEIAEPHYYWKLFCQNPSNDDWNDPLNDHWDTHNY